MYQSFLVIFFLFWINFCFGQTWHTDFSGTEIRVVNDSICQFGKKYDYPKRLELDFLAVEVDDSYKIQELHRAVPQPLEDDKDEEAIYDFLIVEPISDYDPINDSVFVPEGDNLLNKLKILYFFDTNGAGKLDFIHYPRYSNAIWFDHHWHFIFIQTENGYKRLHILGFIVDIKFNEDGTLNEIKTFQPECCISGFTEFFYYAFNKEKNELTLMETEKVFTCQFKPFSPE